MMMGFQLHVPLGYAGDGVLILNLTLGWGLREFKVFEYADPLHTHRSRLVFAIARR